MPKSAPPRRPEILAPVGSPDSLVAALAAGADAVYFGLDEGFNARAKVLGFSLDNLADTVQQIHRAKARAYVTLNTLVFQAELLEVAEILREVTLAGVDAVIVQDPAICLLARALVPGLAVHASTQMTISSPEAARFAKDLGVKRVVVPRELSIQQIERFAQGTDLELETFVHGALCMAWSGQCLSGEAWVGRSANRGQCNQGCRMPYALVVDGETKDLGEHRYLLSPKDLAAVQEIGALEQAGVASLKIEGRYKGPAYVRANVEMYRGIVDQSSNAKERAEQLLASSMVYSRGFSPGHLRGSAHQDLVDGRFPKHRGHFLGVVEDVKGSLLWVNTGVGDRGQKRLKQVPEREPAGLVAGAGVVVDAGDPQDKEEAGGRVYAVQNARAQCWRIDLGPRAKQMHKVKVGHRVWLSAPAVKREKNLAVNQGHAYHLSVQGQNDEPLQVLARCPGLGLAASASSELRLSLATGSSLDEARIRDKFAKISDLGLWLDQVDTQGLASNLFIPPSSLKKLRRALGQALAQVQQAQFVDRVAKDVDLQEVVADLLHWVPREVKEPRSRWVVLCRTMAQLQACIEAGIKEVDLDWMEFVGLSKAVEHAKRAGLVVNIATVRVQKPGEEGYDRRIASLAPDGVLIRHFGALMHFSSMDQAGRPKLHGDFSLNCTNALTAHHLISLGLDTVTASHDLNDAQVQDLMDASPSLPLTLTLHHHLSLFHNDHCIYAKYLSNGQDFRTCKRPCDRHKLHLRDHQGQEHPVIVDVECRNTVFSAQAQSAAPYYRAMLERGVQRFRIEFAWETQKEALEILQGYAALANAELSPQALTAKLSAMERFGVTMGTLQA